MGDIFFRSSHQAGKTIDMENFSKMQGLVGVPLTGCSIGDIYR